MKAVLRFRRAFEGRWSSPDSSLISHCACMAVLCHTKCIRALPLSSFLRAFGPDLQGRIETLLNVPK